MNKMKKILSLCLALMMVLCAMPMSAFAADYADATINMDAKCSLTIWKYDFTNAKKDGVWNEDSFVSTGWRESYVEDILGGATRTGEDGNSSDLGNGQTSNGYAIKGVEFSYLKVADIVTFTESINDGHEDYNMTQVLYGFDKVKGADLLKAIGLENGTNSYANAANTDKLDGANNWYYQSDVLNKAIADALTDNATTVKNALESYMAVQGGNAMALTDNNGKTLVRDLPVGLYLLVETKVPEMVTTTVNPFFVSLPMTSVSGDANSASPEGGHVWNYDVVVYPKNETGIPTLEKTVREAKKDTGKNNASDVIADGFAHNATGSAGDTMEYQIISTLPTITSQATQIKKYEFHDTISEGISYNKSLKDVKVEIFTDKDCTNKVTTWTQNDADAKFTVTYSSDDRHMTVDITEVGLAEINGVTVDNPNGILYTNYSNFTMRVTYTARINSDTSFIYGETGNDNKVVLTWERTSDTYFDTLIDDCHVYSFGIDMTKKFSDKESSVANSDDMFKHVKFKVYNETDGYWVTATRNDTEGIYYVTGHVTEEADATIFYPVKSGNDFGKVIIKGCEDDKYRITEVETANGYTLLKDSIFVDIKAFEDEDRECDVYSEDILGVMQNDPCYNFDGGVDLELANIPQKQLAHVYMTASATIDTNNVNMVADDNSANAMAPLTIVNTRGFDLPKTGDVGTWMYGVFGIGMMAGAAFFIFFILRKKEEEKKAA